MEKFPLNYSDYSSTIASFFNLIHRLKLKSRVKQVPWGLCHTELSLYCIQLLCSSKLSYGADLLHFLQNEFQKSKLRSGETRKCLVPSYELLGCYAPKTHLLYFLLFFFWFLFPFIVLSMFRTFFYYAKCTLWSAYINYVRFVYTVSKIEAVLRGLVESRLVFTYPKCCDFHNACLLYITSRLLLGHRYSSLSP